MQFKNIFAVAHTSPHFLPSPANMQFKNIFAVASTLAIASAQNNASTAANLTALVGSEDRLSTLGQILQSYPNVAATLANATNITVFAPSNDAFQTYFQAVGVQLSDVTEAQVMALLDYHVISGEVLAANITDMPQFVPTLLNDTNYTTVTGGQVLECRLNGTDAIITSGLKSDAMVIQADLNFTSGIAHIIDAVNVIPLNDTATASAANLTYFLGALAMANMTEVLDGLSDVTIFAPSNDAFEAVGSALGNLTAANLTAILQYHVINGTIAYSNTLGNGSVSTLGGSSVNLTVADGAAFVNQARIVNADILVSNGVMHVVDSLLNPNGTAMAQPNNDNAVAGYSSASSVASLPLTSGVPPATTTVNNLITTTLEVASGYSTVTEAIGSGAGGASATSSHKGAAAVATGAVGAAALFGGAAFIANL